MANVGEWSSPTQKTGGSISSLSTSQSVLVRGNGPHIDPYAPKCVTVEKKHCIFRVHIYDNMQSMCE